MRALILGGTGEAAQLARRIPKRFGERFDVVTSLAGRTEEPQAVAGTVRIGGFGGPEGLGDYLATEGIDAVIDATHPFATAISAHAVEACAARDVPRLRLDRPPWPRHPLDRWIEVEDVAGAARALARIGKRAWLTLGRRELDAFGDLDHWFLVRLIDRPGDLPLKHYECLLERGPFSLEQERLVISRHDIDILVAKASGGDATYAKLVAAREKDLPVIMIRRPPPPPGPSVGDVEAALDWLQSLSGRSTCE